MEWGIYNIGHVSNISIRFFKVSLLKLPYLSGLVNYLNIHYFNTQFYDKEKTSKRVFGLESWALYQKWCDNCHQLPANTAYLRLSLSWKLSSLMLTSFTTTGAKRKREMIISLYIKETTYQDIKLHELSISIKYLHICESIPALELTICILTKVYHKSLYLVCDLKLNFCQKHAYKCIHHEFVDINKSQRTSLSLVNS